MSVVKILFLFKNLLFAFIFNSSLLLILIIGIQNSSIKKKVNLLINESVELPLSFVIGTSFITGSLLGSIISLDYHRRVSERN
jgi:uncharacterized integral membrane protein